MRIAVHATVTAGVFVVVLLIPGSLPCANAQTFQFAESIDLGSNLTRIGSLDWSHVLEIDWDRDFSIGGIIGKRNATVIPEIRDPIFGEVIIPRVSADTRTGARMTGQISGNTGLEFYADLNASGLESGASFQFRPEIVDLPATVSSGEFFKLATNPGVVNTAAFTEDAIDLPSFEAGMNFFFNSTVDSKIEYGLFPFVPYDSVNFAPDPVRVDQNLMKFGFDLDPDSNNGVGTPPNFVILEGTRFEERLGLLDNEESVYEKQISVEMSKENEPVDRRLDIGAVQLVNPFGTGDSVLGPNERNLTVNTATNDSSIQYSYETPMLRLGLDLDGIAAYLGTAYLTGAGHSFTRIEESSEDGDISFVADLIDIKYGPEIGFRESVEIKPDFEVTLNFDQQVAVNVDGQVELTNSYTGKWSDLPEIALLGDQSVDVTVGFNQITGEQTKRSVFFLTDYLELTLWELESFKFKDTVDLSLPPLYQGRTSLLGSLLGEVELEITEQTQPITPFSIDAGLAGGNTFTLTPTPTTMVYLAARRPDFSTDPDAWRTLDDHTAPSSLQNAVLVIATGENSAETIADLNPARVNLRGPASEVINVAGLVIPEGSRLDQISADRTWSLSKIVNDGLFRTNRQLSTQINGLVLAVGGQGVMELNGALKINATVFSHGSEHTMQLLGPDESPQKHELTAQQFNNEGTISIIGLNTDFVATQRFSNTGTISVSSSPDSGTALTILTAPELANDGRVEVRGSSNVLRVRQSNAFGQVNIQSTTGTGAFIADRDATLHFENTVLLDNLGSNPQPVRFEATRGGTLQFDGPIRAFNAGVAELHVDETSTMILNGVEVKRENGNVSLVNKGVVEVMSGGNRFYFDPSIPFQPGEEPRIVGINVDNQGTVRIHPNASFGFKAEIADYVPGGATLGTGTWEVIGAVPQDPFPNDGMAFAPGRASLEIDVAYITNDDTYLGRISFGDTNGDGIDDGYSAEDYDTELAVSEANVLLSGAARFNYFNTIRENRGTFTLRHKNHFTTAGDLLNSGEIRIESNARLNVSGDLTVDEGAVFVDGTSILDVGPGTVEVMGGSIHVEREAAPLGVNTPWIVREKWQGLDEDGNSIVLPAVVSFGDAWFPTIGPNAEILVEGEQAVFEPLAGLSRIQGSLTLTGGNELRLPQSLRNEGTLQLETAGKLYVDGNMISTSELRVGADSYLDVTGTFAATSGSIELDGVVQASTFAIDADVILRGSGRFAGTMENNAVVSPGNSPGVLQVLGDYTQSASGALVIDIAGSESGLEYDQLIVDDAADLSGRLDVSLTGESALFTGQQFSVLTAGELNADELTLSGGAASLFEMVVSAGIDGRIVLKYLGGDFSLGDFNRDLVIGVQDVDLLSQAIADDSSDLNFDLDASRLVEGGDLEFMIHEVLGTSLGDANLDGEFDTSDLVMVLQAGKYETQLDAGWSEGDWTADRRFDTADFVAALQEGAYEQGPVGNLAVVPEPASVVLAVFSLLSLFWRVPTRRRR